MCASAESRTNAARTPRGHATSAARARAARDGQVPLAVSTMSSCRGSARRRAGSRRARAPERARARTTARRAPRAARACWGARPTAHDQPLLPRGESPPHGRAPKRSRTMGSCLARSRRRRGAARRRAHATAPRVRARRSRLDPVMAGSHRLHAGEQPSAGRSGDEKLRAGRRDRAAARCARDPTSASAGAAPSRRREGGPRATRISPTRSRGPSLSRSPGSSAATAVCAPARTDTPPGASTSPGPREHGRRHAAAGLQRTDGLAAPPTRAAISWSCSPGRRRVFAGLLRARGTADGIRRSDDLPYGKHE